MPPKKNCVLVVDDDVRMLRIMERTLDIEGYRVLKAATGENALDTIDHETPDLVLLDVMMPGMDGHEVCRRIREFSSIPIIMVTAKDSDDEKINGFDSGADDYITKPFSARELVARVKAVLRRTVSNEESRTPVFTCRDLKVDFTSHSVTLAGQEVNLTATEYQLLCYMASNAGRVLTPDQILGRVWGEEYRGETHLLQVTVARLREKLKEDTKNPKYIVTRHGIGYMLIKEQVPAQERS